MFWWVKFPQLSEWTNYTQAILLVHHFIIHLGSFKQYQFISMYFMLIPMNRFRKMKLFHKHRPDLKNKHWQK